MKRLSKGDIDPATCTDAEWAAWEARNDVVMNRLAVAAVTLAVLAVVFRTLAVVFS